MFKRSPVLKILGLSCVIVPVAFYAGFKLRGGRVTPEDSLDDSRKRRLQGLTPQEYIKQLQTEMVDLDKQRLRIDQKITEVKQRAAEDLKK